MKSHPEAALITGEQPREETSGGPASAVILPDSLRRELVAAGNKRAITNRLKAFGGWLDATGRGWLTPDLGDYRDHMQGAGKSPMTVRAHLSTVRGRYNDLLTDNTVMDALLQDCADMVAGMGQEVNPANVNAMFEMIVRRLENALHPRRSRVKVVQRQDRADSEFIRLTRTEASNLIRAPDRTTLPGLRDAAVIALLLATGIREQELSSLDVPDLRQRLGGQPALLVREGKGAKQRLIPYGRLVGALDIVEGWLAAAGIEEGPVFCGFYKGGRTLRPGRLSVRAIEYILAAYPVLADGETRAVKPHDLRRSYARLLREADVPLDAIQQNLGHADLKTTLNYIGELDVSTRQPPAILDF